MNERQVGIVHDRCRQLVELKLRLTDYVRQGNGSRCRVNVTNGSPLNFKLVLRLPSACTQEQVDKLRIIAAKCPVHRALDGEVNFDERIVLVEPATAAAG